MRKKNISLFWIFALLCAVTLSPITINAAEDRLAPYYTVLKELNEELGTDYTFPSAEQISETGESYLDLVEFYTSMSMDDFRQYVKAAHDNETKRNELENKSTEDDYEITPLAYSQTQKYYYDSSSSNYLYITSTAYTADGATRYSSINSYGYTTTSYPYYKSNSLATSFSSDKTQVTCKFTCNKYVAKGLISNSVYTVTVTFKASGGNVYS